MVQTWTVGLLLYLSHDDSEKWDLKLCMHKTPSGKSGHNYCSFWEKSLIKLRSKSYSIKSVKFPMFVPLTSHRRRHINYLVVATRRKASVIKVIGCVTGILFLKILLQWKFCSNGIKFSKKILVLEQFFLKILVLPWKIVLGIKIILDWI